MKTASTPATARPRLEYQTIDIMTEKGMKEAERLRAEGWKIITVGFSTIQFEKQNY